MKAIIIGSGIAGLAAAIRLRVKGYEVQILEKNNYTGGKLHAFSESGYRFDVGPSLLTMPHWIDELFELAGEQPDEHFQYIRKDTICRYFWEDGKSFSVKANEQEFVKEASLTFDVSPSILHAYLKKSKLKYERTKRVFLEKSLHKWDTYLSIDTLKSVAALPSLNISETLDQHNRKKLLEPHLVQLFNRYATYNGSSPYKTPGIMSLIPHLEMHHGTFFPKGGMHEISQSLTQLAIRLGIDIRTNAQVEEIIHEADSVQGVRVSRQKVSADLLVSNVDVFSTYNQLLPKARKPKKTLHQERSSSALIFYWGIRKTFKQLDLHNIFFSEDYREEFHHIFDLKSPYLDPTVYVNISSKNLVTDAPEGCENWYVMINVPGSTELDWGYWKSVLRETILKKLNRILNTSLEKYIDVEKVWDPVGIEVDTGSYQGSLYGTSSNSRFAAFLRHPNFSGQFKNLYFCGGSAHPGGGIPLCLLSGKIVSDLIPPPKL